MSTALVEKVEKPVNETIEKANAIMVVNTETRLQASEYLKVVKNMQKEVSETFDPIVAKANATWKEACNQRSKYLDPLKEAEKNLKNRALSYDTEQERKARELQAKLEAKAKAEEERKRKELEERAKKAEESGKASKAEELRQKAEEVHVEVPTIQPTSLNIKGESTSILHDAEIVDMKAYMKHVISTGRDENLVIPNPKALKQLATLNKGKLQIPGVKFFTTKSMSSRA